MGTRREVVAAFLACRRVALAGASRDPRSFSRTVLAALRADGYEVVPVNPGGAAIDGLVCAPSVRAVSPPPAAVLVMTSASLAAAAVRDALDAGVRHVWLFGSGGRGVATGEALAACREAGVEPVVNLCPLMFLAGSGWFHRLHGRFARWAGHLVDDGARVAARG